MKRFLICLLALILILPCELPATCAFAQEGESYFKAVFLDVGEGDAAYLECDGYTMLIDGGAAGSSSLIYSFLKQNEIKRLDYIVASHPDADHIGGLSGALNYAQSGIVLCTVDQHDTKPFEDFQKYLAVQDNHITVPDKGDVFSFGSAKIQILSPARGDIRSANTSLILKITYGETSFLFTGDSEAGDEAALISTGEDLKSTVLKVSHHGSSSSTTPEFLDCVRPEYAVISVGSGNTYGHPAESVIERLNSLGVEILRTDLDGDITLTSDGQSITVLTEKNSSGEAADNAGEKLISTADETAEAADRNAAEPSYIVNTNSGKFHYPGCPSVKKMKESNKWYYTGTRDELVAQGYSPCGNCKP